MRVSYVINQVITTNPATVVMLAVTAKRYFLKTKHKLDSVSSIFSGVIVSTEAK